MSKDKEKMKRKDYEKELRKLQEELCHLQAWPKEPKERVPLAVRQIRSFLRAHRPT